MINLKRKRRNSSVPISAMSDVSFILLIFIMLLALINDRKEVKIEYPEARVVEKTEAEDNLEIWVDNNGLIWIDGNSINLETVEGIIIQSISDKPSIRIHIIADKDTPYMYVNEVVSILQLLQHRVVSLVAKEV